MNSSGNQNQNPRRTARKSIAASTSVVNNASVDSTSDNSGNSSQPSLKKTRMSTATRQISPSNASSKPVTRSSNSPVKVQNQSLPSTSSNVSQPGPSGRSTRSSKQDSPVQVSSQSVSSTSADISQRRLSRRAAQSSNVNSSVRVSSQTISSTSSDPLQPGPSRETPRNINSSAQASKNRNIYQSSQDSSDEELCGNNIENLVNKCVSYILVADQKKYSIKKQDIIKNVFDKSNSKSYKTVIDKACQILKKTFGLEILDIENKKNEYLLINILERDLGTRDFAEYTTSQLQKQGLIFYLLTIIYMNENVISEDQLWKALEPLGIDVNSHVPHAIFGEVRKYITIELVRQMYLEYRCISKDPVQYEFVWGQRAKQEVGKADLLKFACKVMGDTEPSDWVFQFNDAKPNDSDEEKE